MAFIFGWGHFLLHLGENYAIIRIVIEYKSQYKTNFLSIRCPTMSKERLIQSQKYPYVILLYKNSDVNSLLLTTGNIIRYHHSCVNRQIMTFFGKTSEKTSELLCVSIMPVKRAVCGCFFLCFFRKFQKTSCISGGDML